MNDIVFVEPYSIFEMEIQASVIQIDCSYDCYLVITYKRFCMQEARLVFIDTDTGFQQLFIVRLCQQKDHLFIRDSGSHNADVHTAFCSKTERGHHLIVNNQVRCTDVDVFTCPVNDVQINIFAYDFSIQGSITVWLCKSIASKWLRMKSMWHVCLVVDRFAGIVDHIPHMQKHDSHIPDSFTF